MLIDLIYAALAGELAHSGLTQTRIDIVLDQLRKTVGSLRPEFRVSGAFIRYVEMIDSIAKINGEGPNYRQWRKEAHAIVRRWKKPYVPLDDSIQSILAAGGDAERAEAEGA